MKTLLLTAAVAFAPVAFAQNDLPSSDANEAPGEGKAEKAKPEAKPGPDVSKMPFSQDAIRTVVTHFQPQIQSCYNETLASKKHVVEGKLMTSFVITPEGLVKKAKVLKKGSTVHDGKLNDCVVAVLAAMEFPKPPDRREQPIEYPFNLKAEK